MQRYFIHPDQWENDIVTIQGDDVRHLLKVLRAEPGYRCIVSDGESRDALVEIESLQKDRATARVIEQVPREGEPAVDVVIAQSLPKSDKLETVIQKCTEIGASAFFPFISSRTVVKYDRSKEAKRLERWNKIAKEAAEQSGRNRIPAVEAPMTVNALLEACQSFDQTFICYENEHDEGLKSRLQPFKTSFSGRADRTPRIMLIVGPEGGFSEVEIRQAEAAGCVIVSLGKRILRTETAPIAALTCILYEFDEMGG